MTRRRPNVLAPAMLVVLAGLAAPSASRAEEWRLVLDESATRVSFDLPATGHDVHGDVGGAQGEIRFDPAGGSASGDVTVALGATKTGSKSRDKTMHKDVLESPKFPAAQLAVTGLEGSVPAEGDAEVTLVGKLTVHGAEHEVRLPAKVTIAGGRLTGTAGFEVPFKSWGMKDPSILFLSVADIVAVKLELAGTVGPMASGEAAVARH